MGEVPRSSPGPNPDLSYEDVHLLSLLATGITCETAAWELGVSSRTVRRRLRDICARIGVATPVEAIVWAAKHGCL